MPQNAKKNGLMEVCAATLLGVSAGGQLLMFLDFTKVGINGSAMRIVVYSQNFQNLFWKCLFLTF